MFIILLLLSQGCPAAAPRVRVFALSGMVVQPDVKKQSEVLNNFCFARIVSSIVVPALGFALNRK